MSKMPRVRPAEPKNRRLVVTGRVVVASVALSAMTACASSFFKITPEDGSTPPAAKPAVTKPAEKQPEKKAEKPVQKPAPKPVEKTSDKARNEEKPPVVTKPAEKVAEKPVAATPEPKAASVAASAAPRPLVAPPVARRPEPAIVEPPAVEPTPAGSDSAGIARLMHAAALWNDVRLFHPAAIANPDAWDNATVRRLTEIRAARDGAQYSQALRRWMAALNDPADRVKNIDLNEDFATGIGGPRAVTAESQVVVSGSKKTRASDTTLVIKWPRNTLTLNDIDGWKSLRDVLASNAGASQVLIDLRSRAFMRVGVEGHSELTSIQREVASLLTAVTVAGPSVRTRAHAGWNDVRNVGTSVGTRAEWRTSDPLVVVNGRAAPRARRVVFVGDATTAMPPAIVALIANKQAVFVSESPQNDLAYTPHATVAMGDRLEVTFRTGELLNADGSIGVQPDTIVAPAALAADSAPVLRTAIQIARGQLQPGSAAVRKLADDTYAASTRSANGEATWNAAHYPIMGARLLALFKSWATLRTFHAYNELRDENIDDALYRIIPRVEAATDAYSYAAAMLDFASSANDAQVRLTSPTLEQHLGAASAPFAARWVESRAIVTHVAPTDAGRASGLIVGEEISAADGFPMSGYINEHRRYGAASNDWSRLRNTMDMVPRGAPGTALYRVRDASGRERAVNIERTAANVRAASWSDRASSAVVRDLGAGFGYLDVVRATTSDVDKAFADMGTTRALIVDARGAATDGASFPAVLARTLQRVSLQSRVVVAKQTLRVAGEPCPPADMQTAGTQCILERRQFDDVVVGDTARRYRGRVVVLVDDRTEGAIEQFALAMETAANATLVGTATAGAAGTVSSVQIPGVMTLTFSGTEVRRPDGGQLQRVGLTPTVDAQPTVKGIRAGTDDVLERAQQWLKEQLDPQPARRRR